MNVLIIEFVMALFFLTLATITDVKTREVPYKISYGLLISAVILNIILSIIEKSLYPLLYGIFGFLIFGIFGYSLYRLNIWGGADVTILSGLGALFGYNFFEPIINSFMIGFIINLFLIGGFFGIIYSFYKGIRYRKKLKYKKLKYMNKIYIISTIFIVTIFIFIEDIISKSILIMFSILIPLTILLLNYIKLVQKNLMDINVNVKKLTEGDWVVKDVVVDGKTIVKKSDNGLSLNQIKKLNELYETNKIKNIIIREGMPFLPSFLASLFLTYHFGNLLILIIYFVM